MRHNPCVTNGTTYSWIAHVEDHFSKYHVIWPQQHKCAEEVTMGLKRHVIAYFGLPRILQTDNGTEFKNELMRKLIEEWEGKHIYVLYAF